jgi:hypothetical protein
MFAYEPYRKEALGLSSSQQQKISSSTTSTTTVTEEQTTIPATTEASTLSSPSSSNSHRGRVKKSPRVMRMFQVKFKKKEGYKLKTKLITTNLDSL